MLTKKLLLSTFGAKIAPYGFEYAGLEARRRFHFIREADGREQSFVIQRDNGSFQLEIHTGNANEMHGFIWTGTQEMSELFWDLRRHFYNDAEELENLLNTLGDHVVKRVIPMLAELSTPKQEDFYPVTGEMYVRLIQEHEGLLQRFLERNRIKGIDESDKIMEHLLRELERIKNLPFSETIETQIELAAVLGHIIIRDFGGEWVGIEIRDCSLIDWQNPLAVINDCCQKGGGAELAKRYITLVGKHRERVGYERRFYGNNWEPPKTSKVVNEGLLSEDIVKDVFGRNLSDMGFKEKEWYWWELVKTPEDKMAIFIDEENCCRKSFFVELHHFNGKKLKYLYKKFCLYKDEAELREQLEAVCGEIKEAILADQQIEEPKRYFSHACHVFEEMDRIFRAEEKEMAERFWTRNGLEPTSKEEDILRCIVREIDSIAGAGYEESKRQLMELGAAYGELLIREIGGHWTVDEEFRMKRKRMYLEDVPVINAINPLQELIYRWEDGGGRSFLLAHQEYKWKYAEWKRLCHLADIADVG